MEAERSGIKPDQILSAAQKRFRHYGLSKTTMNEIAEDIGMSKASLYYYFKDKESIFYAVVQREQVHFFEVMQKLMQKNGKQADILLEYAVLRIDLLKKMLSLGKWSYGSYMEVKPLMMSLYSDFRKKEVSLVKDILQAGITRKEFAPHEIHMQAEFFIATLHGIRQGILSGRIGAEVLNPPQKEYLRIKEHSEMFSRLFIKGISNK